MVKATSRLPLGRPPTPDSDQPTVLADQLSSVTLGSVDFEPKIETPDRLYRKQSDSAFGSIQPISPFQQSLPSHGPSSTGGTPHVVRQWSWFTGASNITPTSISTSPTPFSINSQLSGQQSGKDTPAFGGFFGSQSSSGTPKSNSSAPLFGSQSSSGMFKSDSSAPLFGSQSSSGTPKSNSPAPLFGSQSSRGTPKSDKATFKFGSRGRNYTPKFDETAFIFGSRSGNKSPTSDGTVSPFGSRNSNIPSTSDGTVVPFGKITAAQPSRSSATATPFVVQSRNQIPISTNSSTEKQQVAFQTPNRNSRKVISSPLVSDENSAEPKPYNVNSEETPKEPFFSHEFQNALRESIEISKGIAKVFDEHRDSIHESTDLKRLQQEALKVSTFQNSSTRTIALLGTSGEGEQALKVIESSISLIICRQK
jgi:hypothetical protein